MLTHHESLAGINKPSTKQERLATEYTPETSPSCSEIKDEIALGRIGVTIHKSKIFGPIFVNTENDKILISEYFTSAQLGAIADYLEKNHKS